ncbi:flagellar assembly peptidoglycan hydrolase FlgJ [Marinobacterium mangrovicola]|uniref:Peptidoglycan hydrolase FlgJ n=1 Tax=Marinobacterium mangrovicola TaxID=1476959 RepID=A0A4R1GFN1_9GAMM|nr:flagellar assembly peptidoglycan hydrolase FlgJ [Marinobacterium mangrovicola]TCK07044.1 flagellar protein FlgJ [Marinobacterium mangrovicola]
MDSKIPGQADAALYSDFTSLSKLKAEASKDKDAALQQVAEQFEQVFMNMMLKTMRQANEAFAEDNPFNSGEVEMYQGMLDQQLTMELSRGNGFGLADIIVRQLGGSDMNPETLRQALQMPGDDQQLDEAVRQGESLNEALLNLAARRVAGSSLDAVTQISEKLSSSAGAVASDDAGLREEPAVTSAERTSEIFDSPEQFVERLMPLAEKAAQSLGVDPRVLVAQAALETGWGRSIIRDAAGSSNNLFNIKASGGWSGDKVAVQTMEYRDGLPQPERAEFRAYDSLEQSLNDYVQFIQNNPRYENALKQSGNPVAYLQELQRAGYATDPEYASKIERIFSGNTLAAITGQPQEG